MKEIKVMENILSANEALAEENARIFRDKSVYVVDLMSSPGAGKTSLVTRTIEKLKDEFKIAVIEGDIASKIDAEKIQQLGVETVQINTGGACHLDANMIKKALGAISLDGLDLLIIENVGNLVCPASFSLGESLRAMILSIPEGDDKPLKYPAMFAECSGLVLNKIDLLDQCGFDMEKAQQVARSLNPNLTIFPLSCKTGEGLDKWTEWLTGKVRS